MEISSQDNVARKIPTARRAFRLFVRDAATDGQKLSHPEIAELNEYSTTHPVSDFFLFFAGVATALGKDIQIMAKDIAGSIGKYTGIGLI